VRILVIDVGGSHVKLLASGEPKRRKFKSGPTLTPAAMVEGVKEHSRDWRFDVVTIGYPGPVLHGRPMEEPWNLGRGWVGFDYDAALGVPVRVINDAAMQALGSDEGGRMLFVGLGSGLGTALVDDGHVVPLELAHLPFLDRTFEDYCGQRGLAELGEERWRSVVLEATALLKTAVAAEYVVMGGGNVRKFEELPDWIRRGSNQRAFDGGFRVWQAGGGTREPKSALRETPAWDALESHATTFAADAGTRASAFARERRPRATTDKPEHLSTRAPEHLRNLFTSDPDRASRFTLTLGDLIVDYSKNLITIETMAHLHALARDTGVEVLRDRMFAGEPINLTERRAVLHVALRNRSARPMPVNGRDVMPEVRAALDHVRTFSDAVRGGAWTGCGGQRITDVVNIGIGGSDLGPAMVTAALAPYTREGPRTHFVSNVDGTDLAETLRALDPATTLFTVASKTFTTEETMTNARAARAWFLARAADEAHVAKHFVAISTNQDEVRRFGIAGDNMFVFWDWVGGRYSVWSSIGLPVALAAGFGRFEEFLDGAFQMDEHFRAAPLEQNVPITLGLLGVWYASLLGAGSQAVLPYEHSLRRLPAYLQQLEMESNGKRALRDGGMADVPTAAVIWGEPGTNAQHSFFQLLHQGAQLVPCDFLVGLQSHEPGDHHRLLLANCFAQTEALMRGRTADEAREELRAAGLDGAALEALVPHKIFPGNRPSTTIVYRRLDPRTLGALLAMYEHKVFVMGAVWNINSFDQFGVELGKQLAKRIAAELAAAGPATGHDASTNALIDRAKG
jgi:glucose-6-phosphate isomerase